MKTLKYLSLIFLFFSFFSCAQQKKFVTYKVKEDEKMRDIAKRLNLKTKDLLRLNPNVGRRPDPGTVIIIPDLSKGKEKDSIPNAVKIEKTKVVFQTHTVQPKETVYKITRMYEISKETLMKWNPEYPKIAENFIDVGQVLKVKKIEEKVVEYVGKPNDDYVTHIVGSDDTIYSITQKYDVTKEDLVRLNPELEKLKADIVSVGDVIKIKPVVEENKEENYLKHEVKPSDTLFSLTQEYGVTKEDLIKLNPELTKLEENILNVGDIIKIKKIEEEEEEVELVYEDEIVEGNTIRLAMLFPFNSEKYVDEKAEDIFSKNKLLNIVTDYYLGAKIAVDALREKGVNVELSVFDTGNKGKNVSKLIKDDKLEDFDVLIGPFYASQAEKLADKVDYPVVFPHYSKKQSEFSNDKIIKTAPNIEKYIEKLGHYLRKKYTNENIIIIGDGESPSNEYIEKMILSLQKNEAILSSKIHVLKPEKGYIKKERITDLMDKKIKTTIILMSTERASIADALNSLLRLPEELKADVFAVKKGRAFDKVDNNKLATLNFSYVTDYYANPKNKAIKEFKKKYKIKNNAYPTKYAFKGFDVTYDVLTRLASGKKLYKTFKKGASERLTNKFYYTENDNDCYENKGLFIVKFKEDLSLIRIDNLVK